MRDLTVELKQLRLYGMAGAWIDLVDQGTLASLESSCWLVEHLLQAETVDRAMRSVKHQMGAAKFPAHRDLAGFDFASSKVDKGLVEQLPICRSPTPRTTPSSSAGRAQARRICARRSAWPVSLAMASACGSTPPSTWSTPWSEKKPRGALGASL